MINNLSTIIYSLLLGQKVGIDYFGNQYFVHKKNSSRRWVLYGKKLDPTAISVEWQMWLNSNTNDIPKRTDNNLSWQKNRLPNQTGTQQAYHPRSEKYNNKSDRKSNIKNTIWKPKD
tara:strand:+ start:4722 stop:5072 length:351 start_codon:yes stop_codon:yes gene_type:complete